MPLSVDRRPLARLRSGIPYTNDGFRTVWARAASRAGIKGLTFHDQRGTAAVRFRRAGLSIAEIAQITGHKEGEIAGPLEKHYLANDEAFARQILEKIGGASRPGSQPTLST